MPEISMETVALLKLTAAGPFSCRTHGERLTHAHGITFTASTYCTMIRYGWAKEVA